MLVAKKHRLAIDNNMLKSRLVCESHEKDRLSSELKKMKDKASKQKGTRVGMVRNEGVPNNVFVCAIVSVVVSFFVMKLCG
ncbi:Protein SOGA1 [Bienertia sinuspersici]